MLTTPSTFFSDLTATMTNSLRSSCPYLLQTCVIGMCFSRFRVYAVDTPLHGPETQTLELDDQHYLGEATCALSQIVANGKRAYTLDLVPIAESADSTRKILGQFTVHAEEVVSPIISELVLRCTDLKDKDFFSKSDPFLMISKQMESGTTVPICRTEVVKNNLNPVWKPIFLSISQVGSKDSPLVIECFNHNINEKHDLLGQVQTSLAQLEMLSSSEQGEKLFLPITIGKDLPQKKVLKSQLFVDRFYERVHHSFLDYLSSGSELNFMVAIDFTSSNGNPRLPDSLHYIDPSGRLNAYQKAIIEVGEVLQFYDSDRLFPLWGFGARLNDGPANHCFNLNGSIGNPSVEGIQGIMTAYAGALRNILLAGPTQFGPVITAAANIASQSMAANEHGYFVLLIITDGVVTDLQETKDAIVEAYDLPLSILIVGVGEADFSEMKILDANNGKRLESSLGRIASRDIVQFVPLSGLQGGKISFLQSVLSELPAQFLTYMRTNDIQPRTWPL